MHQAEIVDRVIGQALGNWPELQGGDVPFADRVRELGVSAEQLMAHGHELYLAHLVMAGHAGALRILEREYLRKISQAIARVNRAPDFLDDVRQAVLERLLVGPPPRIGQYVAAGPLGAWLRVMSTRVALNHVKGQKTPPIALSDAVIQDTLAPNIDVETGIFQESVRSSIGSAIALLSVRERNVLRLHFIQELSIDQIGAMYGVHRATAARWLASARKQVLESVEEQLRSVLKLSASEVRSVLANVNSQLHVSVVRLLGSEREHEANAG